MDEVVNVDTKRRADRHAKLKKIKEKYTEILKERREHLRKLAETVGSDDRRHAGAPAAIRDGAHGILRRSCWKSSRRNARWKPSSRRGAARRGPHGDIGPRSPRPTSNDWIDQDPTIVQLDRQARQDGRAISSAEMAHVRSVARNAASGPVAEHGCADDSTRPRRSLDEQASGAAPSRDPATPGAGQDRAGRTRAMRTEQELAMLNDLEQRLNDEIKSISKINQSLTINTLDLQAIQDDVAQMEEPQTRSDRRWRPSTSSWRRPPNPDHRGRRRPAAPGTRRNGT